MSRSKSFVLEKRKRQKVKIKCKNPGHYLSRLFVMCGLAGFISWFILANIPSSSHPNKATPRKLRDTGVPKTEPCVKDGSFICEIECTNANISEVSTFLQSVVSLHLQGAPHWVDNTMQWPTVIYISTVGKPNPAIIKITIVTYNSSPDDDVHMQETKNRTERKLHTCSLYTKLYLTNIRFPTPSLRKNWLNTHHEINSLYLTNSNLQAIDDDAFEGESFLNFITLEIIDHNLPCFQTSFLGHLKQLQYLTFDRSVSEFPADYLKDTPSLAHLKINGIPDLKSPVDLIGNTLLKKIESLNFNNNNFGDTINEFTFINVPSTQELHLFGCQITSLGERSFDVFYLKFGILDLRNNSLITIQADILAHFFTLPSGSNLNITLAGNPWECNYKLLPLADLIKKNSNRIGFRDKVICESPPELCGKELVPELIATTTPPTTTTSEDTTTISSTTLSTASSSTSTTTEPSTKCPVTTTTAPTTKQPCPEIDNSLTKIACKWNENHHPKNDDCSVSETDTLTIRKMTANFTITKLAAGSVQITVYSKESDQNITVIWFSNSTDIQESHSFTKSYCLECARLESRFYKISNLQLNKVYTFCIVPMNNSQISPLNCRSYYVQDDCDESDDMIVEIIVISIVCIPVPILLGVLSMFCLVKYHPEILKDQKLAMKRRKTIKNKIFPKMEEIVNEPPASPSPPLQMNSISEKSERSGKKDSVISKASNSSMKKHSIGSTVSAKSSIIPDYECIPFRKSATVRKDSEYFECLPEHSPPPLPKRTSGSIRDRGKTTSQVVPSNTLQLADVSEPADYFKLYSGV